MNQDSTDNRDLYLKKLVYISLAYCIFFMVLQYRAPMQDGDSFEYAGIARNILRYGVMQEDLLRNYTIPGQTLPHPPSIRANYYVYFLVPFYAIFRDTQWTFIVPAFLGLFLLPLVMYRAMKEFFGEKTAFYAAVITLFSPSVLRLYSLMDPGLPEVWQMLLYILFVYCMLKEKYIFSGICMAVVFSLRSNSVVLIPAALAWLFIYRRKHFFGLPLIKVFGVALIFVMPFFIRNYIVFNDPMYNEQFAGLSRPFAGMMLDRFAEGDQFGIIFNYEAYYETPEPEPASFAQRASYLKTIVGINANLALWGKETAIFYVPGIFQVIGLLLLPFLVWGWFSRRGSPETGLIAMVVAFQLIFHIVFPLYIDRYLLGILPLAFILCAVGLNEFEAWLERGLDMKFKRSIAWAIVVFVIASESAGFFVMSTARLMESESAINEIEAICDNYLRPRTEHDDTVIMTYPFFSTHFVCDMKTIPLPYGNLTMAAKALDKYDGDFLIYSKVWPGDLFPTLPFAREVLRGRKISLFEIDRAALDNYLPDPDSYYMSDFNPVSYFLSNRFNFEMSPPFYKLLISFSRSYVVGLMFYFGIALFFVYFFVHKEKFSRIFSIAIICFVIVAAQLYHVSKVFESMTEVQPNISRIQAAEIVKTFPEKKQQIVLVVQTTELGARHAKDDLAPLFKNATLVPEIPELLTPNTSVFVPVPRKENLITGELSLTENLKQQELRLQEMKRLKRQFEQKGYKSEMIYGGVFAY